MAMHSPSPALSTPGTGRGRSQTSSQPPPSFAPATLSDSEFRADKQKQAQDTRQQALCHQMCTAAPRHWPSVAISGGNPCPRPSHTPCPRQQTRVNGRKPGAWKRQTQENPAWRFSCLPHPAPCPNGRSQERTKVVGRGQLGTEATSGGREKAGHSST